MKTLKVISLANRDVLSEGRSCGLGMGFAKWTPKGLTGLSPISACKDYLNDVIGAEWIKEPISACGLTYTPSNVIPRSKSYLWLLTSILLNKSGYSYTPYSTYKSDVELLKNSISKIEQYMHHVEHEFHIKNPTKIFNTDKEGIYAVRVDKNWFNSPFSISLYALLFRDVLDTLEPDAQEFLNSYVKRFPILREFIEHGLPTHKWEKFKKSTYKGSIHGAGIMYANNIYTRTGYDAVLNCF